MGKIATQLVKQIWGVETIHLGIDGYARLLVVDVERVGPTIRQKPELIDPNSFAGRRIKNILLA
jgi:hypothetical protein